MKKFSLLAALLISGAVYAITAVVPALSGNPSVAAASSADATSVQLKKYPLRGELATLADLKDGAEILLANSNSTYYKADGSQDHTNTFLTSLHGNQLSGYSDNGLNVLEGLSMDNVFVLEKTADQTYSQDGETKSVESFILKHYASNGYLAATPATARGTDSHIDQNKAKATPFAIEHIGMPVVGDDGKYLANQPGVASDGSHCRTEWTIRLAHYQADVLYHYGPFWNYKVAEFTNWDDMGGWNVYLVKWDDSPYTNITYRVAELAKESFTPGDEPGCYPEDLIAAFKAAIADAQQAIADEAGDEVYLEKLAALENAYETLKAAEITEGLVTVYKTGEIVSWDEMKAGDQFVLAISIVYKRENVCSTLENYLQPYQATKGDGLNGWGGNGLACASSLSDDNLFELVPAPAQIVVEDGMEIEYDAYYLMHVKTGTYVGYKDEGRNNNFSSILVSDIEEAVSVTPFGPAPYSTGGVENAVTGESVRLKHFFNGVGYSFGPVWSYGWASWRNANDAFVWNAYRLEKDRSWRATLEKLYKEIGGVNFPAGTDPGYFPEDLVTAYENASVSAEEALYDELDDATYETLAKNLRAAYDAVTPAKIELTDGYYYVMSTYPLFEQYFDGRMAWRTPENNFLYWEEFDESNPTYVFKFEKQADDTWSIQNYTYGNYVGRNAGNEIVMNDELVDTHIIESNGMDGRWHIRYNGNEVTRWFYTDAFAYGARNKGHVGNNSNSYDDGTYNWNIIRVPEDKMTEYAASAEQVRCTGRLRALLDEAVITYNKAFSYTADKDHPLITDYGYMNEDNTVTLGQISTIFSYSENTYPMALGDGDLNTFFRPAPSASTPGDFTSMDIDLRENPTQIFIMEFSKRKQYPGESPTKVSVWATNDKTEDWTMIERVILPGNNNIIEVASNGINMGKPYRYIRLKVEDTAGGNRSWGYGYFSLAEFQMYPAVLNEAASQYSYAEGMKQSADELEALINECRAAITNNTATDAQYEALSAAIEKMAELIADPNDLIADLQNAYDYIEPFGGGDEYGQAPADVYAEIMAKLAAAEAYDPEHLDKDDLSARRVSVAEALAAYKAAQRTVELDTWFYVCNTDTMRASLGSTEVYGDRLYATGTSVDAAYTDADAAIRHGYYDRETDTPVDEALLSTMWRLVNCGDTAVAFQNRASMMYMARNYSTTVGAGLSETPVPYVLNYLAPGQVEIVCDVPGNSTGISLSATTTSLVKGWADHRACSPNSWTFLPVDDSAIESATIEVPNNVLTIFTLPFTSEGLVEFNSETALFYRVSAVPDDHTVELTLVSGAIAAGEPVIMMTGDYEADPEDLVDAEPTVTLYTELPTEDAYSLEGKTVNGLVGTLKGEVLNKEGMGVIRANKLEVTDVNKVIIRGGKGYINPTLVTPIEGAPVDETLTTEGLLDAIKAIVSATKGNNNGNVYTINGQLVKKNADTKGLPRGIYVVGGKKVIVK